MRDELKNIAVEVEHAAGLYMDPVLHKCAKMLRALAAQCGEPVEWQYQDRQGEWRNFINADHRDSTIDSGDWPIRALYAAPPAQCGEPVRWMNDEGGVVKPHEYQVLANDNPGRWRPLYTAPPSQPVALPDGWVAVPKRATRAMVDAAWSVDKRLSAFKYADAYAAMLAAAPEVPRG